MEKDIFGMPDAGNELKLEDQAPEYAVTRLSDGLGFGEGSIDVQSRLESKDKSNVLFPEDVQNIESHIENGPVLAKVEAKDDGCGDGRGVKSISVRGMEKTKSLFRAKVFGGGATMGVAGDIALERSNGLGLQSLFGKVIDRFKDKKLDFGVHTDEHAKGEKSGCGAIDNAPLIIKNVGEFRDSIVSTIESIASVDDGKMADKVTESFQSFSDEIKDQDFVGKFVIDKADEEGAVKKELRGPHKEIVIILNEVEGYTVDQDAMRRITEGRAEAFAVDVWRLKEIANTLYDSEADKHQAFIGMLVYTLSTAGTLTEGDLPVYSIAPKNINQESEAA